MNVALKISIVLFIYFFPHDLFCQWVSTNGPYGGLVSALAKDGSLIYAASETGVFISNDEGNTWSVLSIDQYIWNIHSIYAKNSLIIGSKYIGYSLSKDNGQNWNDTIIKSRTNVIYFILEKDNILFAFCEQGIYETLDNGDHWIAIESDTTIGIVRDAILTDNNILVATSKGVYRTEDNFKTWIDMNDEHTRSGVLSVNKFGQGIFVTVLDKGTYVSYNGGKKWEITEAGFRPFYGNKLLVNEKYIFCANKGGIYRYNQFEKVWESVNAGLSTTNILDCIDIGHKLILATDQGIFISADDGDHWVASNKGLQNTTNYNLRKVGKRIFSTAYNEGLFYSEDQGNNWNRMSFNIQNASIYDYLEIGKYIFVNIGNELFRSEDGGMSWKKMDVNGTNLIIKVLRKLDLSLWIGTGEGIFRSDDYGEHWSSVHGAIHDKSIHFLEIHNSEIYAGTEDGLYVSKDLGINWTLLYSPMLVYSICFHKDELYVGSYYYGVYHNIPNTNKWEKLNTDLKAYQNVSLVSNGDVLFAGTDSGLYYSINDGLNWIPFTEGLKKQRITSLFLQDNNLIAGIYDAGIWARSISDLVEVKSITPHKNDIEVYPNPSSGVLCLETDIEESVDLIIYDLRGVQEWRQTQIKVNNTPMIKLPELSKGMHQLVCNYSKGSISKKFIIR